MQWAVSNSAEQRSLRGPAGGDHGAGESRIQISSAITRQELLLWDSRALCPWTRAVVLLS